MTPEQTSFFRENGYLMIENAIEGSDLQQAQEAFLKGQAEARKIWEENGSARGFFDIPSIL